MQTMKAIVVALFLGVGLAGPVAAGPLEDATAAYGNGDYATALRLIRPLAEQGNDAAQYSLGVMYRTGQGVLQDHVQAHKWFNLAGARGMEGGRRNRDEVATKMTPAQIAEAQRLAHEWKPKQ